MGGVLGTIDSPRGYLPETKLESQMVEAMQKRSAKGSSLKSFNTVILKFPKIDESFKKCKAIFEEFDVDKNGVIDHIELKQCFRKLQVPFIDEEIDDLFQACDINEDLGMEFNEFIVLQCLVYLLHEDQTSSEVKTHKGLPELETTFKILVDAFVFLDKNKDGYVSRAEMIQAINETTSGEHSSGRIGMRRFEEMDWDRNGMVNFKEFLFAFTRWVGIDEGDDDDDDDEESE